MHELGYCSPVLLLCEMELMTLCKDERYEYDVLSRSRQVLILSHRLNMALGYIHTILFCLLGFIQLTNKLIHISKKLACI